MQQSGLADGELDGLVEQRLVGDDPVDLDAARGGEDHLGPRVGDPAGQLGRGEAAEHDRVDRADPGAGQHRRPTVSGTIGM